MKDDKVRNATGCACALFTLIVTTPMWLILLFALMSANQMPLWAWVLYWVYIPMQVLAGLLVGAAKVLLRD